MLPDSPTAPSEPVGLNAAAVEREGAAARAQDQDSTSGADGFDQDGASAAPAAEVSGDQRVLCEMALSYLDSWMLGWSPGFQPPQGPMRAAGVDAMARVAAKYGAPDAPPEIVLAVFVVVAYGPPLLRGWKLRQAEKAEREAGSRG